MPKVPGRSLPFRPFPCPPSNSHRLTPKNLLLPFGLMQDHSRHMGDQLPGLQLASFPHGSAVQAQGKGHCCAHSPCRRGVLDRFDTAAVDGLCSSRPHTWSDTDTWARAHRSAAGLHTGAHTQQAERDEKESIHRWQRRAQWCASPSGDPCCPSSGTASNPAPFDSSLHGCQERQSGGGGAWGGEGNGG